ncbi:glycosyltransferase family 9 protein [Bdellovibrionota bacterium FG-2]
MTSVVVRTPNWIGDQVLAFPFFYYLRQQFPHARITAACMPWVESVQFRGLVDDVLSFPRFVGGGVWAKLSYYEQCAKILKARGTFDLGICLPNSFSSAWILRRAGIKQVRGYAGDGRSLLLTQAIKKAGASCPHRSQAYCGLLPRSGKAVVDFFGAFPENEFDEKIPGEVSEFDWEKNWPEREKVNIEVPQNDYWVLAPGSTADSRRWPTEFVVAFARRVAAQRNWVGCVVGGAAEAPMGKRLCTDADLKLRDYTALGAIPSLGPLLSGAKFVLSNDSGLAHVAALAGASVHIVWGAGDPRRTKPLGPGKVQISLNPVECWPCEQNTCSKEDDTRLGCLRGIQPDAVWEDVKRGFRI